MCHKDMQDLHESTLEFLEALLIKRGGEPLNTAEIAELGHAWELLDELRQQRYR